MGSDGGTGAGAGADATVAAATGRLLGALPGRGLRDLAVVGAEGFLARTFLGADLVLTFLVFDGADFAGDFFAAALETGLLAADFRAEGAGFFGAGFLAEGLEASTALAGVGLARVGADLPGFALALAGEVLLALEVAVGLLRAARGLVVMDKQFNRKEVTGIRYINTRGTRSVPAQDPDFTVACSLRIQIDRRKSPGSIQGGARTDGRPCRFRPRLIAANVFPFAGRCHTKWGVGEFQPWRPAVSTSTSVPSTTTSRSCSRFWPQRVPRPVLGGCGLVFVRF